jgi:peptidoglycan pentaglycine glycine transferase (the first glycine)
VLSEKTANLTGTILAGPGQRARWDSFVASHPKGHLLQSFAWGDFKRRHSWSGMRVLVHEPGTEQPVAGAQILFRQMAGLSVAYIPKGPIVDWDNEPVVRTLLQTIQQVARRRRAIYLKIEPNETENEQLAQTLRRYGFQPSDETVQPRSTIRVDLDGESAKWLERMKPKTRYNIRLAERRGVTVREADPANPADFTAFYNLMEVTGQRDKFGIHTAEYYKDAWDTFRTAPEGGGSGGLLLAEFDRKLVAGVMVFTFGQEAAYFYGASSDEHRREMPTYLLQWRAMQWAREHGARYYDFWGIPENIGENENEQHENETLEQKNVRDGLWGVYRFKQGFGGETVRYTGAYDLVYNRPMYLLWQRMQKLRASR